MPKSRQKLNQFKRSPLSIVLLLVKFFLISVGDIPIYALKTIWRIFPKLHLPKKVKILVGSGIFLIFFFGYSFYTVKTAYLLPSPTKLASVNSPLTTEFYDRSGKLLYRLYEGRNRSLVTLDELPDYLIKATIAIEDKNFYKHSGVDFLAILRATWNNLSTGSVQGASTITQQLIKNTLLTPEKTYSRKLREIFLSFWAERIYTKDEILQMYFNESPYGGPAWGIEAASIMYFGKSTKDLNLAESAFLAGLPASPTEYSPYGIYPERSLDRQTLVLHRMVEDGYISNKEAQDALNIKLQLKPPQNNIFAPHFVMYVKDLLSQKYGSKVVSQGGLKVITSLDLTVQEQIQKIVKEQVDKLNSLNVTNGAAMVTNKEGQILAMVGSKDYHEPKFGNFNVTLSPRQPGSAIKPITYTEAFKQSFTPGNTILDTPVVFKDGSNRPYAPINYDNRFHGPISIRVALGSSYNVPAVKMLATIGLENMIQTARDLGITTLNDPHRFGLSLTLGGGEVKMIEMMGVYGSFSQLGLKIEPNPILKVTDSNGNILEEFTPPSKQVLQEEIAYLITSILADNNARTPAFGSRSLLYIPGHQVAAKTGTTDSKRDNWTFGYTPEFVVGVWVGNNDNSPMHPSLTSGITGAAPIWNKIMVNLLANRKPMAFRKPAGVIEAIIDGRKDLAVAGILPKGLVKTKASKDVVTFFDSFSSYATSSAITSIEGTRN